MKGESISEVGGKLWKFIENVLTVKEFFIILLFFLLVCFVTRRVKQRWPKIMPWIYTALFILMILYITVLRRPRGGGGRVFLALYFSRLMLENDFLNALLFLPLGVSLQAIARSGKFLPLTVVLSFALSSLCEGLQYRLACGSLDVNDLLSNTLGGLIGGILYLLFCRSRDKKKHKPAISDEENKNKNSAERS